MSSTRQYSAIVDVRREPTLGGPSSVVETACPLDCPDACSLAVTVQQRQGRRRSTARTRIRSPTATSARRSASSASASTVRIACSIRRSATAARATASSSACTWDEALELVASRFEQAKADARRRVDPALLLRRLERPADAGQPRRAAVAALRHVAARAHGVRGADRRGQHGALRQDAVGHLPGLSGGEADHPVGREPVGVRHPPHPVRARGAEARRQARRHRSANDAARAQRPTSTSRSSPAPTSPSRSRSTAICSRTATPTRRSCASTRPAPTGCASAPSRGRSSGRPTSPASTRRRSKRVAELYADELARAHPLRLGTRAQPQRRQRRDGGAGAAGGRRQVRRARRRLLDEQLRVVEHRPHLDRRARAATRASST